MISPDKLRRAIASAKMLDRTYNFYCSSIEYIGDGIYRYTTKRRRKADFKKWLGNNTVILDEGKNWIDIIPIDYLEEVNE
jgi:hypothetical protein